MTCRLVTIIPEAANIARDATRRSSRQPPRNITAKDEFIIDGFAVHAVTTGRLHRTSCTNSCRHCATALSSQAKEFKLQVFVRDNNVEQALRVLKKKMQREGVFREMKRRRFYEKPSEQTAREKSEAVRRSRKLARKKAIFDGSVAAPRKKPGLDANGRPKPADRGRPAARR